jgi:hypothetical protein
MKLIKKVSLIINILMIFWLVSIQAQVAISPKNLIGEWTYHGPDSIKISDNVILDRELSDDINFKRWVFNPNSEFILKGTISKEKYTIGYMSKGDKWLVDIKSNILSITRNSVTQYFEVTTNQDTKLILTRIK